jgi:hypothetical protein
MSPSVAQKFVREDAKKVYAKEGSILNFSGNKADVYIQSWNKDTVQVSLQIVFTHPDINVAKKEAGYAIWNINKRGTEILINNNFSLPSSVNKINSIVTVTYQIYVPNKTTLILNNKYGNLSIKSYYGRINLNNSYGNINLNNLQGIVMVYANLCTINGSFLNGNYVFETKNTDYNIKNINGNISLSNNVGTIYIEPGKKLEHLSVKSSNSEVQINTNNNILDYNYDLTTKYAKVLAPGSLKELNDHSSDGRLKFFTKENKPLINVITSFNDIKIN